MANAVDKVNGIAIASIDKINGMTDANIQALNGLEFTGVTDAHVFIASDLASKGDGSHASLGFTSGIDNTYDVYEFIFTNIHGETANQDFGFQVNAYDPSEGTPQLTGFDEAITSTTFNAWHDEADSSTNLTYNTGTDQAQGIALQQLAYDVGIQNDNGISGKLTIFDPSSTTYVKHFIAELNEMYYNTDPYSIHRFIAGYINTQNAITQIEFKFSSGEIQGGAIKMYGIAIS